MAFCHCISKFTNLQITVLPCRQGQQMEYFKKTLNIKGRELEASQEVGKSIVLMLWVLNLFGALHNGKIFGSWHLATLNSFCGYQIL